MNKAQKFFLVILVVFLIGILPTPGLDRYEYGHGAVVPMFSSGIKNKTGVLYAFSQYRSCADIELAEGFANAIDDSSGWWTPEEWEHQELVEVGFANEYRCKDWQLAELWLGIVPGRALWLSDCDYQWCSFGPYLTFDRGWNNEYSVAFRVSLPHTDDWGAAIWFNTVDDIPCFKLYVHQCYDDIRQEKERIKGIM